MIDKMTKYSFILLDADKEQFLERLQELGVVDITRSSTPVDENSMQLFDRIAALKAEISKLEKGSDEHLQALMTQRNALTQERNAVQVWGKFDAASIADLESKGLKISFYCVPERKFDPAWEKEYPLQVIADKEGSVYFTVVNAEGFPVKPIETPKRCFHCVEAEIKGLETEIERYRETLKQRCGEIPALKSQIAELSEELDRYLAGAKGSSAADNHLCTFEGYAPCECDANLKEALDSSPVYYFTQEARPEDNPPIKLRNSRFNALFEPITRMYGMPGYDEFDPTPYLAIFFMLFFAICMGDAGYGLILILFGIAEKKGWAQIGMFKGMGPLITVLGVATTLIGVVLGSFFGVDLVAASWVPESLKCVMVKGEIAGYDAKMVLAVLIGVLHLCLAMVVKSVVYVRRFGFKENISTLGWTLLIVGVVIVAGFALLNFVPVEIAKWLIIGIGGLSALGIFIFNKPGRNPLLNIGSGLWDTYQMATGVLGDVLSYIRLYALGLAGGMLGAAFNNLASMVLGDNPSWQFVPFVVILLVGHVLNLLMSCLGAFVHPLRLNFVEFFKNSGYEGKGLKYNPLKTIKQ